jgi:hypothetical protein
MNQITRLYEIVRIIFTTENQNKEQTTMKTVTRIKNHFTFEKIAGYALFFSFIYGAYEINQNPNALGITLTIVSLMINPIIYIFKWLYQNFHLHPMKAPKMPMQTNR